MPLLAHYFGISSIDQVRDTMTWDDLERYKEWARVLAKADGLELKLT